MCWIDREPVKTLSYTPGRPVARGAVTLVLAALALVVAAPAPAGDAPARKILEPKIKPASDEGEKAIKKFTTSPGFKVDLFAAEPMLANPVCFTIDHKGRFYVAETFRHHFGVTDMRDHRRWNDEDLACRTVQDRIDTMRRNLKMNFIFYSMKDERVRLIEDRDGDGKADYSTDFAAGFADSADGIAAGLLEDRGSVYYTNLPNLWKLTDADGDGHAEKRESLSYGYGVHIGFLGHDLHGLRKGPDGKLYFSIGDRGVHIVKDGKTIDYPDCGAVFRCNPDGGELEAFHTGLRNPQELAFDDDGNLFTGDNNSDAGDKARLVYCVEGGDSGWRIGWQWMERPNQRGPWNAEKMWYPQWKGQAAFLVPPIDNLASGPAGFTHYPGTGMPEKYKDNFFLCDFRGGAGASLIHNFRVEPKGATFSLVDREDFIKGVLATDCDFGVEGGLYISDWTNGWDQPLKGRIYRAYNEEAVKAPIVAETKKLLADGMTGRKTSELAALLTHVDQRVRLEAQWELADRAVAEFKAKKDNEPGAAVDFLMMTASLGANDLAEWLKNGAPYSPSETAIKDVVAAAGANKLARLHSIWALGQFVHATRGDGIPKPAVAKEGKVFARFDSRAMAAGAILYCLDADEVEVRAHAVRLAGDERLIDADSEAWGKAVKLLADPSPRVRFFAAITLGKAGAPKKAEATDAIFAMLRENKDEDPYLRHAGVMGLVGLGDFVPLRDRATDESSAVRMAALVALRRLGRPEVSRFLDDKDPLIVLEAARAVNDAQIEGSTAALAARLAKADALNGMKEIGVDPLPIFYRAIYANFRLGGAENAQAVTRFAAWKDAPLSARLEALDELGEWAGGRHLDAVTGVWRPIAPRDGAPARDALRGEIASLLRETPAAGLDKNAQKTADKFLATAARLAGQFALADAGGPLLDIVASDARPVEARVEALRSLAVLKDSNLGKAVALARAGKQEKLRNEGNTQFARLNPEEAVQILRVALEQGSPVERQGAVETLAELGAPQADALLAVWVDKLAAGQAPPEIQLELIAAAKKRATDPLKQGLAKYEAAISKDDSLAGWRDLLQGGHADNGEKVFFEHVEAQCQKCHTVKGKGGGEVGPELTTIGARQGREYILESVVHPNAKIAEGYENVTLTMTDGKELVGRVVKEDASMIDLEIPLQDESGEEFVEEGDAAQLKKPQPKEEKPAEPKKKEEGPKTPRVRRQIVEKSKVKTRQHNLSAMTEGLPENISRSDLRDIVEFLAGLK